MIHSKEARTRGNQHTCCATWMATTSIQHLLSLVMAPNESSPAHSISTCNPIAWHTGPRLRTAGSRLGPGLTAVPDSWHFLDQRCFRTSPWVGQVRWSSLASPVSLSIKAVTWQMPSKHYWKPEGSPRQSQQSGSKHQA